MRFGKNPLKNTGQEIEPPATITVGVLNFIPMQVGFFQNQLDSLKLCLASIRANSDGPFDLLVVDNGSCPDVRDFLAGELEAGRISYLILNQRNIGKGNALFQILGSAPGDLVFFSDGDYYYHPGWMQAHLDVLKEYPEAGIISGDPRRFQAHYVTANTRLWAEENQVSLVLEKGDLIPEEWTRQSLRSYNKEQEMENQIHGEDWRVTRHGTTAYIGASHGQFLISRRVIEAIPHHRFNQALATKDDYYFDSTIEEAGFMRLSVDKPMVYHIGNVIQEDWLKKEYRRLIDNASVAVTPVQNLQQVYTGVHPHWFWGRWRVQQILRAIYAWAFKTYFENA